MMKRLLSLLLLVTMLFTMLPAETMAAMVDNAGQANGTTRTTGTTAPGNPFRDVLSGSWYEDAVQYARVNGIFSGTSATTFDPDGPMTRGMFVTVLGRMAGVDPAAYAGESAFRDVKERAYYAPYVAWASNFGITSGVGYERFDPDDLITREQMAVFFVRYFEAFNVAYDTGANITTEPADLASVSPWAREMVLKLWKTGLLAGDGGNFNPTGKASRAEAATLAMRTDKAVETWYSEPGVPSGRVRVDPQADQETKTPNPNAEDDSDSGSYTTYYKVNFVTGAATAEKVYPRGTLLSALPVPAQPNGQVFLGWYFDAEMGKPVTGEDRLTANTTLYASFADAVGLEEGGNPNFVSELDQAPGFSLRVKAASQPVPGTDFFFRNITAPEKTPEISGSTEDSLNLETVRVTGGDGGIWTISSSSSGGFTPGHTYQIELVNDAVIYDDSAAVFGDMKQANARYDIAAVRFYNFSIVQDGTLNLKLDGSIKYLSVASLNEADGTLLMDYAGLYRASTDGEGNTTYTANNGSGSFTYGGTDIQAGDTVAVYSGTNPTERAPEKGTDNGTDNGEVAYVRITAINGSTYSYVAAEAEEVLFTPDVLPIDVDAGDGTTGWTAGGTSVVITTSEGNNKLDFSTGYENMGLGADTTVDAGDFLAFYTGTFGSTDAQDQAYGEILTLTVNGDGTTTITYDAATEADVMSAMALYDETQLTEAELQDVIDESGPEIQSIIEARLMESTFFDEAGEYLAELALQTDEVQDVFGEGLTLSDVSLNYADGTPLGAGELALMGNIVDKDAAGKKPKVSVSLTPRLSHFTQSSHGLRAEVAVSYTFEIQKSGNRNKMAVALTAFFEQEVTLGFSVSGGAVWKKKWIFPYIADYRMNGNLDLGTYTGIGITATAKLTQDKEPWGMPWPTSAKEAAATKKIFSLSESIKKKMKEVESVLPEAEATASGGLAEKYAAFMEDANKDWVDLVKVNLLNLRGAVDPFHILAYGLQVDFVVSANLNVAIGMTFQYENFKRHSFTLTVKGKKADSKSVDLSTNGYQFDFYVMGTIGVRAGIRAKATVGLFSTKLAGIGLQIEAGAYARLWGYFYYHLENWKVAGKWQKQSSYSGAVLIEIGAYLEVKFIAEALNGKYSYAPTLYAQEWPLWSAGQRENVYAFALEDDPTYAILNVNTYTLPGAVFDMRWMDLKSGALETGGKINTRNFDSNTAPNGDDEARFAVSLSNPNFTYNPVNNRITVNTASGLLAQSSDMILTWKGAPLSGSSEALRLRIRLNWSNEANAGTLAFESNGGSAVQMLRLLAGTALAGRMPVAPTRVGHTFAGWYRDAGLNTAFTGTTMPAGNTTLYAKWTPNIVGYAVEHYQKALDGQYVLTDTDTTLTGLVGAQTAAVAKTDVTYTGFTAQAFSQHPVAADGSTRVAIYYARNTYNLTFMYGNGSNDITVRAPYGSRIVIPANPTKPGYTFSGWNAAIPATMPAGALTFTAQWTTQADISYTVRHVRQALDGTYPTNGDLVTTETLTGSAGQDTAATAGTYTGFTAQTVEQESIAADGSTVVEIRYERNSHTLSWNVNDGNALIDDAGTYTNGATKYGTIIVKPADPTFAGHSFGGWFTDDDLTIPLEAGATMPDIDLTLYARWVMEDPTQISYTVKHIREDLAGTYPETGELVETETRSGNPGEITTAELRIYEGFTPPPAVIQQTITSAGITVVDIQYARNSHVLAWDVNGGIALTGDHTNGITKYGTPIVAPNTPERDGFAFGGWFRNEALSMPFGDGTTMPDEALTLKAKWTSTTHNCGGITGWTDLNSYVANNTFTDGIVLPSGNYFLTADMTLTISGLKHKFTIVEGSNVSLCLNGYTITGDGSNSVFTVFGTLNLFDCPTGGRITGGSSGSGIAGTWPSGVGIFRGGIFNMYGGTLTGNNGGTACVHLRSDFGTGAEGIFNMYGGTITGNESQYGGVFVEAGNMTVGGAASIHGNTTSGGIARNVYLPAGKTINISTAPPLVDARIFVTTATEPVSGNPINITGATDSASAAYFRSDNGDYEVSFEDGTLKLKLRAMK